MVQDIFTKKKQAKPHHLRVERSTRYQLDSIFLMAFSMAGTFFLKVDHCSSVKLIPETQNESQNSKTTFNN